MLPTVPYGLYNTFSSTSVSLSREIKKERESSSVKKTKKSDLR